MVDFRGEPFKLDGKQDFQIEEITPVMENREHMNSVDALTANPVDRSVYASGSHDHTIKLWDANSHACVKTFRGHSDGVWSLNYLPDGRRLCSASVDGQAKFWDVNSGQCVQSLCFHQSKVYNAAVNEAMTMACTVGADRKIAIWDLRNVRQPVFVNEESTASVTCCDFSTDSQAIITATFGGKINVIELSNQERRVDYDIMFLEPEKDQETMCYNLKTVKNHPGGGNVFVLSSAVPVPNVILYEGWHNEPLHRLETINKYFGHSAAIRYCQFSPDLSKMISCCADHSVRLWDSQSERPLKVLAGHSDLATSACWLNETTVVTGSWDCKILLWQV